MQSDDDVTQRVFEALENAGMNASDLARAMNVRPSVVNNWRHRGVPRARITEIAQAISENGKITVKENELRGGARRRLSKYEREIEYVIDEIRAYERDNNCTLSARTYAKIICKEPQVRGDALHELIHSAALLDR